MYMTSYLKVGNSTLLVPLGGSYFQICIHRCRVLTETLAVINCASALFGLHIALTIHAGLSIQASTVISLAHVHTLVYINTWLSYSQ